MQRKFSERHIKLLTAHLKNKAIDYEKEITEWVEKNPEYDGPSVGLNLNQVCSLWDYICKKSNIDRYVDEREFKKLVNEFQETINFDEMEPDDIAAKYAALKSDYDELTVLYADVSKAIGVLKTEYEELLVSKETPATSSMIEDISRWLNLTPLQESRLDDYFKTKQVAQPAVRVVGLTNEQVLELEKAIYHRRGTDTIFKCINEYLAMQKFDVVPGSKHQTIVGLNSQQLEDLVWLFVSKDYGFYFEIHTLITEYLASQKFTNASTIVGLSHTQIELLANHLSKFKLNDGVGGIYREIYNWHDTQEFVHKHELTEKQMHGLAEYIHSFNGGDSIEKYYKEIKHFIEWTHIQNESFNYDLERMIKVVESPSVDADEFFKQFENEPGWDQIWKYTETGNEYTIICIGELKDKSDDWYPSVTYQCNKIKKFYTRPLEKFVEKFERVV